MSAKPVPSKQSEPCDLPSEVFAADPKLPKDEFDADVAYGRKRLDEQICKSAEYLVPASEQACLSAQAQGILDRFAVVDTLALYYRDRTNSTFISLLVVAFFAMLVLELFAHVLPAFFPAAAWLRLIIWLYPLLWLAAFGLWFHAHRRHYQKKYNEYRALAEGLRVQLFWNHLGLPDVLEDAYLPKHHEKLQWIRGALSFWRERDEKEFSSGNPTNAPLRSEKMKEPSSQEPIKVPMTTAKDRLRRLWVESQLDFFTKTAGPRETHRGKLCKRWGEILFWTSFGLSVILGGYQIWQILEPSPEPSKELTHGESILIFFISMLVTGAALAIAYGEKMAFSVHARQYEAASFQFQRTKEGLSLGDGLTSADIEHLRVLGKEALQENGDWLLLHLDRPLEVIVP